MASSFFNVHFEREERDRERERERERESASESMSRGGEETVRQKESQAGSGPVSTEPHVGLSLTNLELRT